MSTYLDEYMGDFLFDTNQQFYFSREGYDFVVPPLGLHDNYVKATTEIPNVYSPEVIGLHSNAEINYFTQASIGLWKDLIVLQKSSGGGSTSEGGKVLNREDFVLELANKIRKTLPLRFDITQLTKKYKEKSPIQVREIIYNLI